MLFQLWECGVTFKNNRNVHAGTICKIINGGQIIYFTEDVATNLADWPNQEYEYATNPFGKKHVAMLSARKNSSVRGKWIENGITGKYAYLFQVEVGTRKTYLNPR